MKLDYLIIGFPRCGTTTLFSYLREHPDVSTPIHPKLLTPEKEVHLFDNFYREEDWQIAFRDYKEKTLIGEATPTYICKPEIFGRVKKHNPNIKIIIMMRNPINAAYSYFWHSRDARDDVLVADNYIAKNLKKHWMFDFFLYDKYLQPWFESFSCLVLRSEDFYQNTIQETQKVFSFLDLKKIPLERRCRNARQYPSISKKSFQLLADFYQVSATKTCEMLNWPSWSLDCSL